MNAKIVAGLAAAVALVAVLWWQTQGASPAGDPAPEGARIATAPRAPVATAEAASATGGARVETQLSAVAPERGASAPASRPPAAAAARERLRGKVIDCESHAVPGVEIRFEWGGAEGKGTPATGEEVVAAVTDEAGAFEIEVPSTSGHLEVRSQQYLTVLEGYAEQGASRPETVLVVAPRNALRGFVTDEERRPLSGASVAYLLPDGFRGRFREILDASSDRSWKSDTDERGSFELPEIPQIAGARLSAACAGFEPRTAPAPNASASDVSLVLTRRRLAEGCAAGIVVDRDGRPVPGARVGSGGDAVVTTDSSGRFVLSLAKGASARILAVKTGYQPASAEVKATLRDGRSVWPDSLVLKLGAEAQEIAGVIVDSHGKPIPRAVVWIADATWFAREGWQPLVLESLMAGEGTAPQTFTDSAGRFRLKGLEARVYKLGALDASTLAVATSEVPAGTENAQIAVSSADLWDRVAGVVVDKRGNPMAGLQVSIGRTTFRISMGSGSYSSGGGRLGPVVTDAQGRFEIKDVAKGPVELHVEGPQIVPDGLDVSKAARPDEIKIVVLLRCHLKIELTNAEEADEFEVLDGDGKRMTVSTFSGEMTWGSDRAKLTSGASDVVAVEETARTLVLFSKGKEVRRLAISPVPGQVTVVRP